MTKDIWNVVVMVFGSRLARAEYKFNCGITGLRNAKKMSITMLVLVAWARQQLMKTLKQWRKWFWVIVESLLERLLTMLAYCSAHAKHFLGSFSHETCGSEDCSRIVKFWAKTKSHGHCSGDVDNVQRWFSFAQKGHNWWRIMGVWLWHWNQSPIIPMEAFRRAKKRQVRSNVLCSLLFCQLQWRGPSWILATRSHGQ